MGFVALFLGVKILFESISKTTHGVATKFTREFCCNAVSCFFIVAFYGNITVSYFFIVVSYENITVR